MRKSILAIAILGILTICFLSVGSASAETFGSTTVGSRVDFTENYKLAENITLTDTYTIDTISFYSLGIGYAQAAVYSSAMGAPNHLLEVTDIQEISDEQWYNFTLTTPLSLTAGTYYIAVCANGSISWYNVGGTVYPSVYNENILTDGFSISFGAYSALGNEFSMYATGTLYVAPTPTPAPTTTITNVQYFGFAVFALFVLISLYFTVKPIGTINLIIGISMLAVMAALAVGGYIGSFWVLTLFGAIIGIVCMLRGTDLL